MKKKILHEISSSQIHIVEMSSSAVNGRRKAKLVLHEIFPDNTCWQENGLSWLREYTEQNMHTVEGMSVTVEFADDKKIEPFGHGYSGVNPDSGMPEFNDAVMVGFTYSPKIEEIMVNGKMITALTAEASLDQHRYPLFVDWLFSEVNSGSTINGSVEIVGADEGSQIQYEAGEWTPTGRVPVKFAYSGYAILGIRAADPSAVILELSAANNQPQSDLDRVRKKILELELNNNKQTQMQQIVEKEKTIMDEKLKAAFDEIKTQIAKNVEINELEGALEKSEATVEQLRTVLTKAEEERDNAWKELDILRQKIDELTELIAKKEIDAAVSELNTALSVFTDEQRKVAQKEIDAYRDSPNVSEINSIVATIKLAIADKMLENAKIMAEQNSFVDERYSLNAVFGSMDDDDTGTGDVASMY